MTEGILNTLFPQHCCICRNLLTRTDDFICPQCHAKLLSVNNNDFVDNKVTKLFWGKARVSRGASLWIYSKGSYSSRILVAMKYGRRNDICRKTGRMLAGTLLHKDFFRDIDIIIPIPLSKERKRQRGYNQAEQIALGIQDITGLPIDTKSLIRAVDNPSQTSFAGASRLDNVQDIFSMSSKGQTSGKGLFPRKGQTDGKSPLEGKHILMVDDILTTGATINSAIQEIAKSAANCTFSILTIGLSDNS